MTSFNTLTAGSLSTNDHGVDVEGTGNIVISGPILVGTNGGCLYKGANEQNIAGVYGKLTLGTSNNYAGGTWFYAGILDLQNGSALGSGALTADHQTPANSLYLDSPAGINVANNMTLSGDGTGKSDSGDTTTGPGLIQNVQGNNSLTARFPL